jgi:hypothetical protein
MLRRSGVGSGAQDISRIEAGPAGDSRPASCAGRARRSTRRFPDLPKIAPRRAFCSAEGPPPGCAISLGSNPGWPASGQMAHCSGWRPATARKGLGIRRFPDRFFPRASRSASFPPAGGRGEAAGIGGGGRIGGHPLRWGMILNASATFVCYDRDRGDSIRRCSRLWHAFLMSARPLRESEGRPAWPPSNAGDGGSSRPCLSLSSEMEHGSQLVSGTTVPQGESARAANRATFIRPALSSPIAPLRAVTQRRKPAGRKPHRPSGLGSQQ